MRIFKYELPVGERTNVAFPGDAIQLLDVGVQNGSVVVWALVDPGSVPQETFDFLVIPTGHVDAPDHDDMRYFATAKDIGCAFVWHVFYVYTGPADD